MHQFLLHIVQREWGPRESDHWEEGNIMLEQTDTEE